MLGHARFPCANACRSACSSTARSVGRLCTCWQTAYREAPLTPPVPPAESGGALENTLEARHGARVQLRDARLAHTQHLAQILELHAPEIVHRNDAPLAFGQLIHGARQSGLDESSLHGLLGIGGLAGSQA